MKYKRLNMKKLFVIIMVSFTFCAKAQEVDLPTYLNHMMENPFVISPAYAGIGTGFQLRINGVSQWVGVEGAPNTQSITTELRLNDRLGGGLIIFNDKNGYTKQVGAKGSLAYHLILSDLYNSFFSFSLGANYTQFSINTEEYNDYNDVNQKLPNISQSSLNFDLSMLYRFEKFAISANVINILNKDVRNLKTGEPTRLRRFSVLGLYTHRVNHKYEIEPSIYAEFYESDTRSHTDINLKVRRKIRDGYFWIGGSYTVFNDQNFKTSTIAPLIGLKKKNYYFAYGTSFSLSKISKYNVGTHMITLGLDYNPKPSLARCTQDVGMF